MKIFANKNIWKKIVIAFIVITLFTFTCPKSVNATLGGELVTPICDFLTAVGDFFVHILHKTIMGQDLSLLHVNIGNTVWEHVGRIFQWAIIIAIVVGAGIAVASTGTLGAFITAKLGETTIASIVGTGVAKGVAIIAIGAAGWAGISVYNNDFWRSEDIYLPMYSISPEAIFKGEIGLFNVNFFDEGARTKNFKRLYSAREF